MKRITLIDKAFLLKRTPLFNSLDLDLLLPIADKLELIEYDAGEVIFKPGDQANRMYIIVRGTVTVQLKGQGSATLTEDDFFGDESLFNEQTRAYQATSKTDAQLFSLSKTNLMTTLLECPSAALGFLQVYTKALPFRNATIN